MSAYWHPRPKERFSIKLSSNLSYIAYVLLFDNTSTFLVSKFASSGKFGIALSKRVLRIAKGASALYDIVFSPELLFTGVTRGILLGIWSGLKWSSSLLDIVPKSSFEFIVFKEVTT